jgi:hypothetical protein
MASLPVLSVWPTIITFMLPSRPEANLSSTGCSAGRRAERPTSKLMSLGTLTCRRLSAVRVTSTRALGGGFHLLALVFHALGPDVARHGAHGATDEGAGARLPPVAELITAPPIAPIAAPVAVPFARAHFRAATEGQRHGKRQSGAPQQALGTGQILGHRVHVSSPFQRRLDRQESPRSEPWCQAAGMSRQ